MAAGIRPSFFIGDNDSVSEEARQWSREEKIPSLLFPPEKDLTDLQLALKEASGTCGGPNGMRGCTAILTGAFGGRFDHLFANLYSLIWAEEEWGVKVRCEADGSEALFILRSGETLRLSGLEKGGIFSTLALSEKCLGVRKMCIRDSYCILCVFFAAMRDVHGIVNRLMKALQETCLKRLMRLSTRS